MIRGQHEPARGRIAFQLYLRTGRRLTSAEVAGLEFKFNPYHDPRNGQFTFGPGGSRLLVRDNRPENRGRLSAGLTVSQPSASANAASTGQRLGSSPDPTFGTEVTDSSGDRAFVIPIMTPSPDPAFGKQTAASLSAPPQYRPAPPMARGGNVRAFDDPMTLEQVFPGLRSGPGGAIIAASDVLGFTGPANQMMFELNADIAKSLINQIKAIDPEYRFESLGPPTTIAGQINQNNNLRFDRAAALYRVRETSEALQVETLRFLQIQTDMAYAQALKHLRDGRLTIRLSEREALGNYVDRTVRDALRDQYRQLGFSTAKGSEIRVNARENVSETDGTFRRPDVRVGRVAFDVTLTEKTLAMPQIRGFFATDFKPDRVIIVRPSQLGGNAVYAITRPEVVR